MGTSDLSVILSDLFTAERNVRKLHTELADAEPLDLLGLLGKAVPEALEQDDEDEKALRLVRVASLLGEFTDPKAIDLLIDILGCEEPEARHAAGVALEDLAYDRFKDVALGIERALERLDLGNAALVELPYLLANIPEGGVLKLLARFARHKDPDAVAAAIESMVEYGDPAAVPMLTPLLHDKRSVQLEDDEGEEGGVMLGDLAREAVELLSEAEAPSTSARSRH